MRDILLLLAGAAITWASERVFPPMWRRLTRRAVVDIHVEPDPGIFLAGHPNWDAFGFMMPFAKLELIGSPPGEICRDWYEWAEELGAVPARWQRIRVTVVGHQDETVVVDGLRVRVTHRATSSSGTFVLCRTGGADAVARGFRVNLDWDPPLVDAVDPGGSQADRPAISIAKGEVEVIELEASLSQGLVDWAAELLMIVNGKRRILPIRNGDRPFSIAGTRKTPAHEWVDSHWVVIEGSGDWE